MIPLLRQILRTGILTEPAPAVDEALRVTQQRLEEAMRRKFGRKLQNKETFSFGFDGDFQVDYQLLSVQPLPSWIQESIPSDKTVLNCRPLNDEDANLNPCSLSPDSSLTH